MVVASQTWELALPGCASLKAKRSVVRSLKDRLRARFNVSVSETGWNDQHARAMVSVAVVTTDSGRADAVLDKIDEFVDAHPGAVVTATHRERHR
jgi:uncharacterized protein YlxP (DUF503 family)